MTMMPVLSRPSRTIAPQLASSGCATLQVAVVNNMPDAALRTTERQWRELLAAASEGSFDVAVRFYSLPEVPRGDAGKAHVAEKFAPIDELWAGGIDGLVVTGTEPIAPHLVDEPYWPALTRLIDWAAANTISTLWSCLAAHAAVRHLDGIDRRPLGDKLSGIYESTRLADHPLTAAAPARWRAPHSRLNELPEEALTRNGYRILAHSDDAGADVFMKECGDSLFLFLQSHLEYDGGALLREYRRDIKRFLAGESRKYPQMPRNYFDDEVAEVLAELRAQAMEEKGIDLIENFPAAADKSRDFPWREPAIGLCAGWLRCLAAGKADARPAAALAEPVIA
ncbi:MAG TPA: homoserine O-succinyltransferase [Stellaceae bacterium]|jgi:homoserine O-succinyltransferase|nr:homoserine O-succinyltransferase [Stellaceae bacterium]